MFYLLKDDISKNHYFFTDRLEIFSVENVLNFFKFVCLTNTVD